MTQSFWSEPCAGGWVLELHTHTWSRNGLYGKGLSDLSIFDSRAISESYAQQGLKLFEGGLTKEEKGLKLGEWLLAAQLDLENCIVYKVWPTAVAIH